VTLADHSKRACIDCADDIQVDKAVIERRNEGIGHGVGKPGQVAVGAGRVHHHEIVGLLDRTHRLRKTGELDRLVLIELEPGAARDAKMHRYLEIDMSAPRPGTPILQVTREASLP
jgi:hypothetical protein